MFNKNDPLINSVKLVMEKNELERSVEKALNEAMGIVSMGALPHEKHAMYKELYKDILAEATFESNLQELSREKLNQYRWKAMDDVDDLRRKTVVGGTRAEKDAAYAKIDKKIDKRFDGIDLAKKKIQLRANVNGTGKLPMNETEQLDELSKKTLGSYIKKASSNLDMNSHKAALNYAASKKIGDVADQKAVWQDKETIKRRKGIDRAADKLAKEETQLDEISKNKANAYLGSAVADLTRSSQEHGRDYNKKKQTPEMQKNKRNVGNRQAGIERAIQTLNKEEYDNTTEKPDTKFRDLYRQARAKENNRLSVKDYITKQVRQDYERSVENRASSTQTNTERPDGGVGKGSGGGGGGGNSELQKSMGPGKYKTGGMFEATDKLVKEGMSKDELRALIAKSASGKEVTKVPAGANSGIKGSAWRNASMSGKKVVAKKTTLNDPHDLAPSATFKGTHTGKRKNLDEVSSDLLRRYVRGASVQATKGLNSGTKEGMDKYMKRRSGVMSAAVKITNKEKDSEKKKLSDTPYHDSYTSAIHHAINDAKMRGYELDQDDYEQKVTLGPGKPGKDKTVSHSLKLSKNGKPSKKGLHIQVYNRGGDKTPYEKNHYISEDENLQELSKEKLGRYVKKADASMDANLKKINSNYREIDDYNKYGERPPAHLSTDIKKYGRKADNRAKGANRAEYKLGGLARVNATEENLQELSRNAVMSYLKTVQNGKTLKNDDRDHSRAKTIAKRKVHGNPDYLTTGGFKPAKVMAKEENIQELSKGKLEKYIRRSSDDFTHNDMVSRYANTDKEKETGYKMKLKRNKGMSKAYDKLDGNAKVNATEETLQELTGKGALEKIRNHYLNKETEHKKQTDYTTSRLYTKANDPEVKADSERVTKNVLAAHGNTVRAKRAGMLIRKRGEMSQGQDTKATNANLKMLKSVQKNTDKYIQQEQHTPDREMHKATLGATDVRQKVRNSNTGQSAKGGKRYNVTQKKQSDNKKVTKINFEPEHNTIHGY
jgi:hypothetical protein